MACTASGRPPAYQVTRPISRLGWFIIGRLFGCHDRRVELRAGMGQTLQRIRETAERDIKSGHTPPGAVTTP